MKTNLVIRQPALQYCSESNIKSRGSDWPYPLRSCKSHCTTVVQGRAHLLPASVSLHSNLLLPKIRGSSDHSSDYEEAALRLSKLSRPCMIEIRI